MKKTTKFEKKMAELAEKTELNYDYGDDGRLFADGEYFMDVFAEIMTEEEWDRMEKEMEKATINRRYYTVYAWNDCSGYKYWKYNDSNYIQITAHIKNVEKVDPEKLKNDIDAIFDKLCHWHNVDEYYGKARCEECGRNPVGAEEETLCIHCAYEKELTSA